MFESNRLEVDGRPVDPSPSKDEPTPSQTHSEPTTAVVATGTDPATAEVPHASGPVVRSQAPASVSDNSVSYSITAEPNRTTVLAGETMTMHVAVTAERNPAVGSVPSRLHPTPNMDTGQTWSASSIPTELWISSRSALYGTTWFNVTFQPSCGKDVAASTSVSVTVAYYTAYFSLAANRSSVVNPGTPVTFTARPDYGYAHRCPHVHRHREWHNDLARYRVPRRGPRHPQGAAKMIGVLTTTLTKVGTHTITTTYSGDDGFAGTTNQSLGTPVASRRQVRSGSRRQLRHLLPVQGRLSRHGRYSWSPGRASLRRDPDCFADGEDGSKLSVSTRTGSYSVAWNGRTSSGILVAAAKYKVVQTVRDAQGHAKAFTSYTSVSGKRLYWYSGSTTKYADQVAGSDQSYYGWVSLSYQYARGINLYGDTSPDWAAASYSFKLPAAAQYGTITFSSLGTPVPGYGSALIGVSNYATGEIDGARWTGRSYAWYGTSVSGTAHVSATQRVNAYVWVSGDNYGWYDVAKVRLTYRYALLK